MKERESMRCRELLQKKIQLKMNKNLFIPHVFDLLKFWMRSILLMEVNCWVISNESPCNFNILASNELCPNQITSNKQIQNIYWSEFYPSIANENHDLTESKIFDLYKAIVSPLDRKHFTTKTYEYQVRW